MKEDDDRESIYDTRFEVIVKLIIDAPTADDAYSTVTEILQEGICFIVDKLDSDAVEPIHEFDITSVEPAELF